MDAGAGCRQRRIVRPERQYGQFNQPRRNNGQQWLFHDIGSEYRIEHELGIWIDGQQFGDFWQLRIDGAGIEQRLRIEQRFRI
jgi:hypothetical protein